jgi:hypothetical protein
MSAQGTHPRSKIRGVWLTCGALLVTVACGLSPQPVEPSLGIEPGKGGPLDGGMTNGEGVDGGFTGDAAEPPGTGGMAGAGNTNLAGAGGAAGSPDSDPLDGPDLDGPDLDGPDLDGPE